MGLKNAFGDLNLEVTQLEVLDQLKQVNGTFARILEKRFSDDEEVRYDIPLPASLISGSIYIGVALDNSSTADPVWTVVRFYFNSNRLPIRARIQKDIAWDNRTVGW